MRHAAPTETTERTPRDRPVAVFHPRSAAHAQTLEALAVGILIAGVVAPTVASAQDKREERRREEPPRLQLKGATAESKDSSEREAPQYQRRPELDGRQNPGFCT